MTSPAPRPGPADREGIEREWLARLRAGDQRALEEIFRAFVEPLHSFALSYVEARDTADEIVQDLFCRLWDQRFSLEMPRGMRPYLYTAVRNRALNALRSRRTEVALHDRLKREIDLRTDGSHASDADGELMAGDLADAVTRVVAQMPPRCREVFTMLRQRHLSYAEVGAVLGISPKTVEIHMARALAILRDSLAPWLRP